MIGVSAANCLTRHKSPDEIFYGNENAQSESAICAEMASYANATSIITCVMCMYMAILQERYEPK